VIDAAADIASRDGIDALSMRRLAEELDVSTMAAYRHVPSKVALVEALLIRALLEAKELADDGEHLGRESRAQFAVEAGWGALERYDGLRATLRHKGPARAAWEAWLSGLSSGYGERLVGMLVGQSSITSASVCARLVVS
jgi:AcrR family transcriptional regulator